MYDRGCMAEVSPAGPLQSPAELKAQIEAERLGLPFLVYRDGSATQQIYMLPDVDRVTVGRSAPTDICLDWDTEVSRLHAELERFGGDWTIADDGLSRNGTHVNSEKVVGRRRLQDRDVIRFGRTTAVFRKPGVADLTDRYFFNVGSGYQMGFQNQTAGVHTRVLSTNYLRVAVGGGVRF